jgi:hypothetical protein
MLENTIANPNAAPAAINLNNSKPALPRKAYSLKEAAQILGISYISAFRLVQRGLLRSSSALRTKIIPATELDRFLKETTLTE